VKKKEILVGVFYRPPNTNVKVFTELMLSIIHTQIAGDEDVYIMGFT